MLIVNEKRDRVANLNQAEGITLDIVTGTEILILGVYENDVWTIERYDTHEEAHKVLMDIVSAYANGEKVFIMP